MILEARAKQKWVHMSPRKMRLVADMVRNKGYEAAVNELHFSTRRASEAIEKAIRSALANLMAQENAANVDTSDVYIKSISIDEGRTERRWRPRAMGRATRIRKRSSHINVVLATRL